MLTPPDCRVLSNRLPRHHPRQAAQVLLPVQARQRILSLPTYVSSPPFLIPHPSSLTLLISLTLLLLPNNRRLRHPLPQIPPRHLLPLLRPPLRAPPRPTLHRLQALHPRPHPRRLRGLDDPHGSRLSRPRGQAPRPRPRRHAPPCRRQARSSSRRAETPPP